MTLTEKERNSELWVKLKAHLEQRMQELRESNDSDLEPKDTAHVRGRIAECKEFIHLEEPAPKIPEEPPDPL